MTKQSELTKQTKKTRVNPLPVPPEEIDKYRQRIFSLVARRAYEIFANRGWAHGHDWEDWYQAESETLRPVVVELSDSGNAFIAVAAVSGYRPEDLKISAEPRCLRICGLPPQEQRIPNGSQEAFESPGPFFLSFNLPADIKLSEISTELRYDVLEVRLPKESP